MHPNLKAMLDAIARSEGATLIKNSDDGYRAVVGGGTFKSYADHPRRLVKLPRLGISSSAAGRYQLLARYYDAYKKSLRLNDFSPNSQDLIAIQQIKEQGAYNDILAGRIEEAVRKCKNIWASLPGAGYGQHEHDIAFILSAYQKAGGALA